jgi:Rrf2 family protein
MDILRRNSDYALRLMVNLARRNSDGSVSTRVLADEEEVSYQLACKLMQQLHAARLVESCMGPRGGFRLGRGRERINILEIIEAIQGPVRLNRCLLSDAACPRLDTCPVRGRLGELQEQMEVYLRGVTLAELVESRDEGRKSKPRKTSRRKT